MNFQVEASIQGQILEKEKALKELDKETEAIEEASSKEWSKFAKIAKKLRRHMDKGCDIYKGYSKGLRGRASYLSSSSDDTLIGWMVYENEDFSVFHGGDDLFIFKNSRSTSRKWLRKLVAIKHELVVYLSLDLMEEKVLKAEILDYSSLPGIEILYQEMFQKVIDTLDEKTLKISSENEFKKLISF